MRIIKAARTALIKQLRAIEEIERHVVWHDPRADKKVADRISQLLAGIETANAVLRKRGVEV